MAPFADNLCERPFSLFAWVQGGKPGQAIFTQRGGTDWLLAEASTGALATHLKSTGRTSRTLSSQAVITDGNWHRVALVWDGGTRTLYVDDALVAEDTQDNLKGAYQDLIIGSGANLAPGSFWSGLIDDVRLYNRVIKP